MSNTVPMYCAYLRKSRADREAEFRGEMDVLARHRANLTELSAKLSITISKWYCEVVSGDTIEDRPEMQKLLRDVESGMWDGVFVIEVERLARGSTKDQGIVADTFKYSNTKIITLLKTYDPNDESDEEYFEFGLFMSRREYKTINRRLQRGRITALSEGKFIAGTAPYGYRKIRVPHDKGNTLEIIPDQASVVRNIFEWYCYGYVYPDGTVRRLGPDMIAANLDELGIKPPVDKKWSKATISDIIKNKTYSGYVVFGQYKEIKMSVDGKIVKKRAANPNYLCYKGLHPAIISLELYELAQEVRVQNRKNTLPSSSVLQNPLSGIVYCKKCGRMMTRLAPNSRNKYSTLKCQNRYCNNVSAPLFLVEEQVLQFLTDWSRSYELNNNMVTVTPLSSEITSREDQISKIKTEISKLEKQMEKAYDLLEQEVYTTEVFKQRQSTIRHSITELDMSLCTLSDDIANLKAMQEERELFVPRIRHLLSTYKTNTPEVNNQILTQIIEKITYEKNTPNTRGKLLTCNFMLDIFPKIPSERAY